jgi:hypothetical protein
VEWSQSFPPPIVVSAFSITNKSFVHPFIFPNNDRQYCYWKAMEGEGEAYSCRPAKAAAEMQYKSAVCRPLQGCSRMLLVVGVEVGDARKIVLE